MLWALVVAQAAWFWWVYDHGWFLQADLSNMVEGLHVAPTPSYLAGDLGGHFSPVTRLVYWFMGVLSPMDYGLSIALRIAAQAAATVLLHRLLVQLSRSPRVATVIVAVYAFSPLLVVGTAMFTPGSTILIGQLLVVAALLAHVRYETTGRLRHELLAGLLLAVALLSSEQWVVAGPIFPLLSLTAFARGGFRARVRALLIRWRAWLLLVVPFGAVVALAAARARPVGAKPPGLTGAYRLLRDSWLKSIGASFTGGPLDWLGGPTSYLPFSAPSTTVIVLGQVLAAAVVVLGVQRGGRSGLWGWSLPLVAWVASMMLVGYRGFASYALLVAVTPRYMSALAVFFAVGAAVAFTAPADLPVSAVGNRPHSADVSDDDVQEDVDAPKDDDVPPEDVHVPPEDVDVPLEETADDDAAGAAETDPAPAPERARILAGALVLALVLGTSLVSARRFATIYGRLPAESYVEAMQQSVNLAGQPVNVYDTDVPAWLISPVEPHHRVSDILTLLQVHATIESARSVPLIAAPNGALRKSVFVAAAQVRPVPGICGTAINGKGTTTLPLERRAPYNAWWLNLTLFQSNPSTLRIQLVDAAGRTAAPLPGATVTLAKLEAISMRLPPFAPVAVRITSTDPGTAICLTRIAVGAPFPVAGP